MTATPPRAESGVSRSLDVLLRDAIDYAGLFPPAQLDVPGAVAEYAAYLDSPDAWALGRFVVPAGRVRELAADLSEWSRSAVGRPSLGAGRPWRLSVVTGADAVADIAGLRAFEAEVAHEPSRSVVVEAVEARASTPDAVRDLLRAVNGAFIAFVEIPLSGDPAPLVRAIRDGGGRAKVRTGGTTADAFPPSAGLARFLAACVNERVPFKATAGLHHPLRGDYALTYAPGSAVGTMFGFLNLFLATALLVAGEELATAEAMLNERDPRVVRFTDQGTTWRDLSLTTDRLAAARALAIASFGSCSFREPIDDLSSLGML